MPNTFVVDTRAYFKLNQMIKKKIRLEDLEKEEYEFKSRIKKSHKLKETNHAKKKRKPRVVANRKLRNKI